MMLYNQYNMVYKRSRKALSYAEKRETKKLIRSELKKEVELKYYSTGHTNTIDYSGTLYNITGNILQGTTNVTRIGNEIRLKRFQMQGSVTAADATNSVLIVAFTAVFSAEANPVASDVADWNGNAYAPFSYREMTKKDQIKWLWSKRVDVDTQAPYKTFRCDLRLNKKIQYEDNSASAKNNVYVMYISDSGTVTHPTVLSSIRLYFEDA